MKKVKCYTIDGWFRWSFILRAGCFIGEIFIFLLDKIIISTNFRLKWSIWIPPHMADSLFCQLWFLLVLIIDPFLVIVCVITLIIVFSGVTLIWQQSTITNQHKGWHNRPLDFYGKNSNTSLLSEVYTDDDVI